MLLPTPFGWWNLEDSSVQGIGLMKHRRLVKAKCISSNASYCVYSYVKRYLKNGALYNIERTHVSIQVYYICMFGWIDHRFTNLPMWVNNNNSPTPSNLPLNPEVSLWLQILEHPKLLLDESKPKPPNLWFAWHSHFDTLAIAEEATILTIYSIQLTYTPITKMPSGGD